MTAPWILAIAQRRVDALLPESLHGDLSPAYARKDQLQRDLETRGTSAVAVAELRLLTEALDGIEAEFAAQQKAEIDAEYAWLRHAERGSDDGFEQWEAERGLF